MALPGARIAWSHVASIRSQSADVSWRGGSAGGRCTRRPSCGKGICPRRSAGARASGERRGLRGVGAAQGGPKKKRTRRACRACQSRARPISAFAGASVGSSGLHSRPTRSRRGDSRSDRFVTRRDRNHGATHRGRPRSTRTIWQLGRSTAGQWCGEEIPATDRHARDVLRNVCPRQPRRHRAQDAKKKAKVMRIRRPAERRRAVPRRARLRRAVAGTSSRARGRAALRRRAR